jgi:hypothetical protein
VILLNGCPTKKNVIVGVPAKLKSRPQMNTLKAFRNFGNLLDEMGLLDASFSTSTIFNDNCGAVDWFQTSSSKGLRHLNI